MDFSRFHEAIEAVLRRPVWVHEFAIEGHLEREYEKKDPKPTFEEIMQLIPKEKRVLLAGDHSDT